MENTKNILEQEVEEELESLSSILNKTEFSYFRQEDTSDVRIEMQVVPRVSELMKLTLDGATCEPDNFHHLTPIFLTAILPNEYPRSPPRDVHIEAQWITKELGLQVNLKLKISLMKKILDIDIDIVPLGSSHAAIGVLAL